MMEERVQKAMEGFSLPKGCLVTVALSGGQDSVALLSLLKELPGRDFRLEAAHVHHGLRAAADADRQFCEALCREWQIPLRVFCGDAAAYAAEHGMSPEEGARALRYGFLDTLVGENAFVATAHHREDQLETFFINLYRGSGSRGLGGIRARRGQYLRPLLEIEKEALVAYAEQKGLPFVTDETNADTAYLRNFLRHEVLPLLCGREDGDFAAALSAAMENLREEEDALAQWAQEISDYRLDTLAPLPDAVLKRVLDRLNGAPLDRLHFRRMAEMIRKKPPSGQLQLGKERYFRIEYGSCCITRPEQAVCLPARVGVPVNWGDWQLLIQKEEINSPFTHFMLDCDKISGNMVFRRKRPGDRFKPRGKGGTSHLQKRLKNDRVPRSRRDALWVLADEQDRLLWVEGYGAAEGFGCDEATKFVYCIKIGGN